MKCAKLLQTAGYIHYFANPPNSFGSLHSFGSSFIKNAPRFARQSGSERSSITRRWQMAIGGACFGLFSGYIFSQVSDEVCEIATDGWLHPLLC